MKENKCYRVYISILEMLTPTLVRCYRSQKTVFAYKRKLWQAVTLLFLQPFPSEPTITRFDVDAFGLC